MTDQYRTHAPQGNVPRGTIMALIALPAGVVVCTAIYQLGFVASIVAFGVAWLAVTLYRVGSGAPLDRTGAVRVAIITIGTIVVSIFAAIVWDGAVGYASGGGSPIAALSDANFWTIFFHVIGEPATLQQIGPQVLISLVFGALGCFSTLRRAFRATAPTQAAPDTMLYAPPAPPAPPVAPTTDTSAPRGPYGILAHEDEDPSGRQKH